MRDRIEAGFAAWGHLAYRHAWPVIALVLAISAALGTQLGDLELDTSTDGFLHEGDPLRVDYGAFREQFGRDDLIVVAIKTPDVFDLAFLEKLREFHRELEEQVPNLVDVQSLINARNTRGVGDELVVGDLFEDWPETPEELAGLADVARSNPLYRDQLITPAGDITTVLIQTSAYSSLGGSGDALAGFDEQDGAAADSQAHSLVFITGEESAEIVAAVAVVAERYDAPDFAVYASGTPVLTQELMVRMQKDMVLFTGLAILTITVFLGLLFRRFAGVALPMVTVLLSLACTLACMAMAGVPISLPTQILPSFLLAVGVGNSVHVLAIFFQHRRRGHRKEESIAFALGHSGLAVLMTSLTTAGGLVSFAVAEIAPVAHFGVFAPVGVLIALVFTLALLPALIAVFPIREPVLEEGAIGDPQERNFISQRILIRTGNFATAHARPIVLVTAGLLCMALLGALQLRFSHDPMKWFPEEHPARIANDLVNDEMQGSAFLEVLVDTGRENGLYEPELLNSMEEMRLYFARLQMQDIYVGKTVSILDVVRETHKALNENQDAYYSIPQERELIAQELLLFENSGSDDLEDLVDSQLSKARMTLKLPFVDAIQFSPFIAKLQQDLPAILGPEVEFTLTGLSVIFGGTMLALIESMARTYVLAILIITPLMVLLIGRVRLGLVAMIPNIAPILLTLGWMGWTGFPMDAFTLLIGCIALGLAVDDTIHFMHNFRRYFERSGDVADAVRQTLQSTGQAMLYTTLVLSAGFFIYMLASMTNLFYFGFLTGITILFALLADVVLAPALMALVAKPRRKSGVDVEERLAVDGSLVEMG